MIEGRRLLPSSPLSSSSQPEPVISATASLPQSPRSPWDADSPLLKLKALSCIPKNISKSSDQTSKEIPIKKAEESFSIFDGRSFSIKKQGSKYILASKLDKSKRPITKLVLGGGGAKSMVYPAILSVLREAGFLPGLRQIYGSSISAVFGGLMACGVEVQRLTDLSIDLNMVELIKSEDDGEERHLKL